MKYAYFNCVLVYNMKASERADSGSGIAFQCISKFLTKFQVIDFGKQVNKKEVFDRSESKSGLSFCS